MSQLLARLERLEMGRTAENAEGSPRTAELIRQRCRYLLGDEPDPLDPGTRLFVDAILEGLRK